MVVKAEKGGEEKRQGTKTGKGRKGVNTTNGKGAEWKRLKEQNGNNTKFTQLMMVRDIISCDSLKLQKWFTEAGRVHTQEHTRQTKAYWFYIYQPTVLSYFVKAIICSTFYCTWVNSVTRAYKRLFLLWCYSQTYFSWNCCAGLSFILSHISWTLSHRARGNLLIYCHNYRIFFSPHFYIHTNTLKKSSITRLWKVFTPTWPNLPDFYPRSDMDLGHMTWE